MQDLKIYTLGPAYAHGETRKSPAVDGIVLRDPDGKELRLATILTEEEREIARKICLIFKQNICGFDIIRWRGKSYVCDVNGWSFVKGNARYYDKAARIMRKMCLASEPGRAALAVDPSIELGAIIPSTAFQDGENNDVCRAMVAIFRHADRTPKQKLKIAIDDELLLGFFPENRAASDCSNSTSPMPISPRNPSSPNPLGPWGGGWYVHRQMPAASYRLSHGVSFLT